MYHVHMRQVLSYLHIPNTTSMSNMYEATIVKKDLYASSAAEKRKKLYMQFYHCTFRLPR